MTIDLSQTRTYLNALAGSPDAKVTWQWFADKPSLKGDKSLCGHRHGSLTDLAPMLAELNSRGAGIFVTVNQTDGEGRKSENVTGLRALFIDDDNQQELRCIVPPNIRVRSRRGEQWYWLLEDGEPLAQFRAAQLALSQYFHTDSSINDLPRVMRVPGFDHVKADPFPVKLLGVGNGGPYTIRGLLADMGLDAAESRKPETAAAAATATSRYAARALEGEITKLVLQQEGGRHQAIFAAAAAMGALVAGGEADEQEVLSKLATAARAASNNGTRKIDEDEIQQTLADGLARGKAKPREARATPPPHGDDDAPPEVQRATSPEKPPGKTWQGLPYEPTPAREPGCDDDAPPRPTDRLRPIGQAEALRLWKESKLRQAVSTGIGDLDAAIGGGLPVGQVTTVLGYTGVGKSEFARQIRRNAAAIGHPVIHVDVELGATRILERDLAQETGIPAGVLRGGKLTPEEDATAKEGEAKIAQQTNIVTISPGCGVSTSALEVAIANAMTSIGNCKPALLIIDSLQRLSLGADGESLRVQMLNFNAWVEAFARAHNVAVLVTSEQRRTQDGKIPSVADVLTSGAESRSIEFGCDVLLGLVPKAKIEDQIAGPCDEEREREIELVIAKNRNGGPGYCRSSIVFMAPCWRMRVEARGTASIEIVVLSEIGDEEKDALTATEIARRCHRRKESVLAALELLYKRNLVVQDGTGRKAKWYRRLVPRSGTNEVSGVGSGPREPREPMNQDMWND